MSKILLLKPFITTQHKSKALSKRTLNENKLSCVQLFGTLVHIVAFRCCQMDFSIKNYVA